MKPKTPLSHKLTHFGRALDVIGKILAVLCFIALAVCLFGAIGVAVIPDDIVLQILSLFSIDQSYYLNNTSPFIFGVVSAKIGAILALTGWAAQALVNAVILLILSSVFKATALNKTPFVLENAKRLKIIGIVLLIGSIAFGLNNLVFAFCVFAFAYVIQYGAELQQQADETL